MSLCSSSILWRAVLLVPTILKIGRYVVYFWSNENNPREFIHVLVSVRRAGSNATKLWIASSGEVLVDNNNSKIPEKDLNGIIDVIKNNIPDIEDAWFKRFGEIRHIR